MIVMYLERRSGVRIGVVVIWAGEVKGDPLRDYAGRGKPDGTANRTAE